MNSILRTLLGPMRYCQMFHEPTFGDTIEWYGRWCRACGIFHGGDRRSPRKEAA